MRVTFSKVFINPDYNTQEIKVNGREFSLEPDGSLIWLESDNPVDFDPSLHYMSIDDFHDMINTKYKLHKSASKIKRTSRNVAIAPTHWYRTLSVEKKTELCMRLKEKVPEIVNNYISNNPSNKLNDYYLTLVERARYVKFTLPELSPKDLAKLPHYDESVDKLYGSPAQILKLVSVVFPSGKRSKNATYY